MPKASFTRTIARLFKRNFEGAGGGRRWHNQAGFVGNFNQTSLAAGRTLAQRGEYYVQNNPYIASAVHSAVSNIIGTGLMPSPKSTSPTTRAALKAEWTAWTDRADCDGRLDFYGLQSLMVRTMIIQGESFCRMLIEEGSNGKADLRLQIIHPGQVPRDLTRDLGDGRKIIAGIEFDSNGKRAAYHIYTRPLGDPLAPPSLETIRIPADDMIHLFAPVQAGQIRGISWLTPALLAVQEMDKLADALVTKAQIAAMLTGYLTSPEGTGGFDGTQTGGTLDASLEPGTVKRLAPGEEITFTSPPPAGDGPDLIKANLRAIAASLNLTYEQISGDLTGVNYSSIRAGLVESRRRLEQTQHTIIAFQLCRTVWRRWIALNMGSNPDLLAVEWVPQGWQWVDPVKDAAATETLIALGIKSRSEAISERGLDPESVDAEIAADQARAKGLGLFAGRSPRPASPDPDPAEMEAGEMEAGYA